MKMIIFYSSIALFLCSCEELQNQSARVFKKVKTDSMAAHNTISTSDSVKLDSLKQIDSNRLDGVRNTDTVAAVLSTMIDTKNVHPEELVRFSETLIGVPYKYGSTDPKSGFDCSGFITYVFNHFGITVPRSSIDFTDVGKEVASANAKRGDIILFTGTDSSEHFVGHMGIVFSNADTLRFIHSTSGKANGVTITPLNKYYLGRFVKTIRIFPQNN